MGPSARAESRDARHAYRHPRFDSERELRAQHVRAIVNALSRSKSLRFACVEAQNPQPGFDENCASQISFYRAQGGFPLGEINEVSRSNVNEYRITVYELGLIAPEDLRPPAGAGSICPRFRSVLLPAPFWPITPSVSPAPRLNDTSWTAQYSLLRGTSMPTSSQTFSGLNHSRHSTCQRARR